MIGNDKQQTNKIRVVFDIGHGSDTFPARGKGIYLPDGSVFEEHDFNSEVAMRAKELAEYNGFEVLLPQQPHSPEVPLNTRSAWINQEHRKKPILCLMSFHANASTSNPNATGWGVFHWYTSRKGKQLAELWAKHARELLPLKQWGSGVWESKPNHWSNYHILRETAMPAILIEHFFFTNLDELKQCNTPEYIELSAQVAVKALCEYAGVEYKYDKNNNEEDEIVWNEYTRGIQGALRAVGIDVEVTGVPNKETMEGVRTLVNRLIVAERKLNNCTNNNDSNKTIQELKNEITILKGQNADLENRIKKIKEFVKEA